MNPPRYTFQYLSSEVRLGVMIEKISRETGVPRKTVEAFLQLIMILALKGYEGRFFPAMYLLGTPERVSKKLKNSVPDPFENLKNPPVITSPEYHRTFFNYSQFPGVMYISPDGKILGVGRKKRGPGEWKEFVVENGAILTSLGENGAIDIIYPGGDYRIARMEKTLSDPKKGVYLKRGGVYRYYVALEGDAASLINGGKLQLLSTGRGSADFRKTLKNILNASFMLSLKGYSGCSLGAFFILGRHRAVNRYLKTLNTARYYTRRNLKVMIGDWKNLYPFFTLDGAIAVAPDGRVWGVGKYVNVCDRMLNSSGRVQEGGTKTQAALTITKKSECVAVTVSVDGDIRVFERGEQVALFSRYVEEMPPGRSRVDLFRRVKGFPFRPG